MQQTIDRLNTDMKGSILCDNTYIKYIYSDENFIDNKMDRRINRLIMFVSIN